MSRAYQIFLVSPEPGAPPLRVDADDVDLEFSEAAGDIPSVPAAFNFSKGDDNVSVAWIPFETVRAIIS